MIVHQKDWYYVAQNNLSGGVYTGDKLRGNLIPYGNVEVYDVTSGSKLNLFVVQHFANTAKRRELY